MKGQPNRLPSNARHFAGAAIERRHPVKFKFNGRTVSCFEGDTVLTALMASGYDTAGERGGHPVGLTMRHAPPIVPARHARDIARALPMERTPATQGAEYLTLGAGPMAGLEAMVQGLLGSRALGLNLDDPATMQRPWLGATAETGPATDLVVIGGGVAGMSTALAGAKAGLSVTLVEANSYLGGNARLFGTQDKEETPEQCIDRLTAAIAQSDAITVMTGTEAIAARPGAVRVHLVSAPNGEPAARVIDLPARYIAVATGVVERLPIFSGNRLPGVCTTLEAFNLAYHFALWPGTTALVATVTNVAYRLAMLATDAGVSVLRIMDGRSSPQSRYIEFSKAYGITMAAGTIPSAARPAKKGGQISLTPQLAFPGRFPAEQQLQADRLLVCAGWQPDLTLWHMAGGESRWNQRTSRLEPDTTAIKGVALAGSAAGYVSRHACLLSGRDAVRQLLGRARTAVAEKLIDPLYETPDDPAPIAARMVPGSAPAFLDGGQSYLERPEQKEPRWPAWVPFLRRPRGWSLADMPHSLVIADIAAGTQLSAIPAESAGIVAQERVALIPINAASPPPAPAPEQENAVALPAFLSGRFGPDSTQALIAPIEKRRLEVGGLIYPNADETDPFAAVGVVVHAVDNGAVAVMSALAARPGMLVFVREDNRPIAVRQIGAYEPGLDLKAALGGGASPP